MSQTFNVDAYIEEVLKKKNKVKTSKYLSKLDELKDLIIKMKDKGLSYKDIANATIIKDEKIPTSAVRYFCINKLGYVVNKQDKVSGFSEESINKLKDNEKKVI